MRRSFAFPGRRFRDAVRTAEKFSKDAQKIKEGLIIIMMMMIIIIIIRIVVVVLVVVVVVVGGSSR